MKRGLFITEKERDTLLAAHAALDEMIALADAWAMSGPEGYTSDERKLRNAAIRVHNRAGRILTLE